MLRNCIIFLFFLVTLSLLIVVENRTASQNSIDVASDTDTVAPLLEEVNTDFELNFDRFGAIDSTEVYSNNSNSSSFSVTDNDFISLR